MTTLLKWIRCHSYRYFLAVMTSFILTFALMVPPAYTYEATVYVDVVRNGHSDPVDTIYADNHYEFRVWAAQDWTTGGFSFPFRISSPDDLTIDWLAVPDGHGEGSWQPGYGCACITSAWLNFGYLDLTGLVVNEYSLNGELSDTLQFGGVGFSGIPSGPLRHWVSLHFAADPMTPGDTRTLCIDSVFEEIPSNIRMVFTSDGGNIAPLFDGPFCWPVAYCCDVAGDANNDGMTGVGDAVYTINYVFKGGPPPMCMDKGDANADGSVNVGDAVYMIGYIFNGGPPPTCP